MKQLRFDTFGNLKQKLAFEYLLGHPEITEIWYGWAAWWGKSYTWVAWQWMMCNQYPWYRGFFGREELKRLKQTTLATYFKFLWDYKIPECQKWNYNAQDSTIRFPNASEILLLDLAYLPSDPLYTRFWSLELTGGYIDESAEVDGQCISILSTRVWRWKNEEYSLAPKILEGFNPDKGHVYRRYYKPYIDGILPRYRVFIPALATDNKRLPRSYIEQLEKTNEVTKQRLLYGNFNYDDTPWRLFDYNKIVDSFSPKVAYNKRRYISCDVARQGKDKCVIFVWKWYNIIDYTIYDKSSITEIIEEIRYYQNKYSIDNQRTIVDEDWVWGWVVDWLGCIWFINNSTPISPRWSKNSKYLKRNYANLKIQCYFELARVVNDWLCYFDVDSEIKDKLSEELDMVMQIDIDKDSKVRIINKEDIKNKIGRSPDYSDACMMRCYFSLIYDYEALEEGEELIPLTIYDWKTFEQFMLMDDYEEKEENLFDRIR
jgi:phage terminase large subunit